jgi:glycosyltransferase involved in cell wall biosynthesis
VSNARNLALDVCRGEYITFLDDDDSLSPTCLDEMLKIAAPNIVVECYPYAYVDGDITQQVPDTLTSAYENCVRNSYTTINRL